MHGYADTHACMHAHTCTEQAQTELCVNDKAREVNLDDSAPSVRACMVAYM